MHICPHEISLVFQIFIYFEISYHYIHHNYQYIFIRIVAFIRKSFDVVTHVTYNHQFGGKYYGKL
jgi:hypothetical protein